MALSYLNSISTHFRAHQQDYAKVTATAVTAYLVNRLWGKYATLCFVAAVFGTLPAFGHQIQILSYADLGARSQVITAALIPASYLFTPIFAPIIAPILGSLLALSTLNREWKQAEIADATQKEIDKLRTQNQTLEQQCQKSQTTAQDLQQELDLCLKITAQIEQIFKGDVRIAEAAQKADVQLVKVSDKIQRLSQFYQTAATQEQLLERMKTARVVEDDLTRLTQSCTTRQQQLATLSQEISALTDQLRPSISSIATQDTIIQSKVQILGKLLKELQAN
jgi:hypothetical protein